MSHESKTPGEMIAFLRNSRAFISQDELAKRVGVTKTTICNWEMGRRFPDLKYRKLLMEALDFSRDEQIAFFQAAADQALL